MQANNLKKFHCCLTFVCVYVYNSEVDLTFSIHYVALLCIFFICNIVEYILKLLALYHFMNITLLYFRFIYRIV